MVSVSLNSTGDRANPIVTKRKVVFTPFRILDKEKFLIVIHYVVYIRLIETSVLNKNTARRCSEVFTWDDINIPR